MTRNGINLLTLPLLSSSCIFLPFIYLSILPSPLFSHCIFSFPFYFIHLPPYLPLCSQIQSSQSMCLSSRPNWDIPPPLPQASVSPGTKEEGTHSPAGKGVGPGGPNADAWRKSLTLCLLCAGDKVDYGRGLSYRHGSLCSLTSDNPMPWSTLSPQSGTMNWASGHIIGLIENKPPLQKKN